ncbi:hypothetical protein JANAI61_12040 [Jannaschia sp. AI_61]|nr:MULTISPECIES: SIMPL domain-containing protein [unclassified Jannaschia]GIT90746.1 hypothetical protein JANAI61_12040 [Jannaschia sp. AI_61]
MRALFLCLALLGATPAVSEPTAARLQVQGQGTVEVVPDMATVTLAVVREAQAAGDAMAALAEATEAVLGQVTAQGIASRDVQTGQLSLQPRWDHSENRQAPRILGYVARSTLRVRVRGLDKVGPLLDAAVADGANGLEQLSFSVSDPRPGEDAARADAVADALAKAAIYAEAAGLDVGRIVSLSEGHVPVAPGPVMMEMAAARSMPIAPGEVTQSVTVTLIVEMVAPD